MTNISFRVPDDLNQRLELLASELDRKKSYLIRKAIEEFIEEQEDLQIAMQRLSKKEKEYTLAEIGRRHLK